MTMPSGRVVSTSHDGAGRPRRGALHWRPHHSCLRDGQWPPALEPRSTVKMLAENQQGFERDADRLRLAVARSREIYRKSPDQLAR